MNAPAAAFDQSLHEQAPAGRDQRPAMARRRCPRTRCGPHVFQRLLLADSYWRVTGP